MSSTVHSTLGFQYLTSSSKLSISDADSTPVVKCNCLTFDGCVGEDAIYEPLTSSDRVFRETCTNMKSGVIGSVDITYSFGVFQFITKITVSRGKVNIFCLKEGAYNVHMIKFAYKMSGTRRYKIVILFWYLTQKFVILSLMSNFGVVNCLDFQIRVIQFRGFPFRSQGILLTFEEFELSGTCDQGNMVISGRSGISEEICGIHNGRILLRTHSVSLIFTTQAPDDRSAFLIRYDEFPLRERISTNTPPAMTTQAFPNCSLPTTSGVHSVSAPRTRGSLIFSSITIIISE